MSIPKFCNMFPGKVLPNIINMAIPSTISGKAMGRSIILFITLLKGKLYLDREYAVGIATSITQDAAIMEVDRVNLRANCISSEKNAFKNPSNEGITNMLPIIRNKMIVKIKDMDMKDNSNLLLILSTFVIY